MLPILDDNYVYLLHEPESGSRAIVDPGDGPPVLAHLKRTGWRINLILNTHRHGDHVAGNLAVKAATGAKVLGPAREADSIPGIDRPLVEGDTLQLGSETARVIETPGHTAGHIAYWFEGAGVLFSGDTLFALGCGRLFEGDAPTMWGSLQKLAALPPATRLYCGHEYTQANARFALSIDGNNAALRARAAQIDELRRDEKPTIPSTIADELATNPFLRPNDPSIRRQLGMEKANDVEVFAEIRRRKDRA
ncbi:hydroxyacylglutathione hydrolase [Arboricoccus pini]|nr:hydroxyacylglutathione hydrolase [Arboricoccus pini]